MRLSALESRVEAQLALGAGKELVPQLEQFVAEHPLRERLIGGLMLAFGLGKPYSRSHALRALGPTFSRDAASFVLR